VGQIGAAEERGGAERDKVRRVGLEGHDLPAIDLSGGSRTRERQLGYDVRDRDFVFPRLRIRMRDLDEVVRRLDCAIAPVDGGPRRSVDVCALGECELLAFFGHADREPYQVVDG